jgi:NADPH:quinone reductase-like Zn-dependent oxidoreductase
VGINLSEQSVLEPYRQDSPYFELEYPFIFGTDVAGTVVQLGSSVTRFQLGQRVLGYFPQRAEIKQKSNRDHDFADAS